MPSVTIVMRTYERPVFLARALASVCGQTYADWELVVVNNGGASQPVDNLGHYPHLVNQGQFLELINDLDPNT